MGVPWSEADRVAASFLAVVPPPAVVDKLTALLLPAGVQFDVLPHITVKAQPNLDEPEVWRPAVRAAVATLEPLSVTLTHVARFGEGIVYLAVDASIEALHRCVLAAVDTVVDGERFEYEGDHYVPHLTLAAEFAGHDSEQLRTVEHALSGWAAARFTVEEVVEFRRTRSGGRYDPIGSFPMAARKAR